MDKITVSKVYNASNWEAVFNSWNVWIDDGFLARVAYQDARLIAVSGVKLTRDELKEVDRLITQLEEGYDDQMD